MLWLASLSCTMCLRMLQVPSERAQQPDSHRGESVSLVLELSIRLTYPTDEQSPGQLVGRFDDTCNSLLTESKDSHS